MRGDAFTPVPNRGMITISIMLANIMQGLDNTILNVALPHIQGSLSASLDQVAWALTSYIVCSAIMMPLTGWLAGRFGIKHIFLASIIGFTIASALCGAATSLGELVAFRALHGVAGAGLIPLSQATLLQINPPERHGHAMAVFGVGTICGPIMGPALGGWLTQEHSWRWVFYINLPIGLLCTLGVLVFIRHSRNIHREPFDVVGFLALSLGIGALQLLLDRGELKDWFNSSEIWIEATIAGLGLYLFSVHTVTTDGPSFLNRDLLKSTNFTAGTVLMFAGGLIMTGTLALLSTMLQNLMAYPAMTTGFVTMPRGLGAMAAMFVVAPTSPPRIAILIVAVFPSRSPRYTCATSNGAVRRLMCRPVRGGDHGSACRKRHQDPRGARLEGRACAALHGLVMFAEAACLPQPERHPVGIASCRPDGQREFPALVSRHQSARAGAGAGA